MRRSISKRLNIVLTVLFLVPFFAADSVAGSKRLELEEVKLVLRTSRNFSNKNLSRLDLSGMDLSNSNLKNADLRNVNLKNATIRKSDFGGAQLGKSRLQGADLNGADFSESKLDGVKNIEKALNIDKSKGLL